MTRRHIAFAALPLVFSMAPVHAAPKAKLPLVIYDEASRNNLPYVPSGYMGNTRAMHLSFNCPLKPHSGKDCIEAAFVGKDWGGVVWQSPANDWGDRPGGYNLSGAHKLIFWARGAHGGEKVIFEFGLLGKGKRFQDSASGQVKTVLTNSWKPYSINLTGKNLTDIKSGFAFVVVGPTTFYLDDVKYQ